MNGRTTLLIAPMMALALAGCNVQVWPASVVQGSGSVKSESRQVQGFDRVQIAGVGTLTITQGSAEALTVQAEDNLLPRLRSDVQDGALLLAPSPGTIIRPTRPIRYDLTVKQLRAIAVSGAAEVGGGGLDAGQLTLDVSGACRMNLTRLTASALTVRLSGSSSVTVSGQAPQQTVSISGAGRYVASDLESQRATASISGAGQAALRVSDSLSVTISGAGRVRYAGSPTVDQHVSGAGSVTKTG